MRRKYAADYVAGKKNAYRADILIAQAEYVFLAGLRKAVDARETVTPLTNIRYTADPRGAVIPNGLMCFAEIMKSR